MGILLMIAAVGLIALGYLIMNRIDRFIGSGGFLDSPQGRANCGVLLYRAPEIAPQIQRAGMKCTLMENSVFPDKGFYSAVFALSANDAGNLAVCRAAKRADPSIYMVARCNEPELREAFEAAGVDYILGVGETVDSFLAELRGMDR